MSNKMCRFMITKRSFSAKVDPAISKSHGIFEREWKSVKAFSNIPSMTSLQAIRSVLPGGKNRSTLIHFHLFYLTDQFQENSTICLSSTCSSELVQNASNFQLKGFILRALREEFGDIVLIPGMSTGMPSLTYY